MLLGVIMQDRCGATTRFHRLAIAGPKLLLPRGRSTLGLVQVHLWQLHLPSWAASNQERLEVMSEDAPPTEIDVPASGTLRRIIGRCSDGRRAISRPGIDRMHMRKVWRKKLGSRGRDRRQCRNLDVA
jgi:hypothetical protein